MKPVKKYHEGINIEIFIIMTVQLLTETYEKIHQALVIPTPKGFVCMKS
jgi:hypothetical protein